MNRRHFEFPAKDKPFKNDVRTLGALLGDVLREQGGAELFAAVEIARKAAIRRREQEDRAPKTGPSERELIELVGSLEPSRAEQLVRAFAAYFGGLNLAEKIHRIRRRRDYLRSPKEEGGPQVFSLEHTLQKLAAAGITRAQTQALFERMWIEPVFTAHPTEAIRRALLEKQQAIARHLVSGFDPSLTPPERRALRAQIRAEITAAWQTEDHPAERPSVTDEAERVLFYVTDILYRVIPPFYEDLATALDTVYGPTVYGSTADAETPPIPRMISFSSWVGGDMDGNPNVTADTLRASLKLHRDLVLGLYRQEMSCLGHDLSQSLSRVDISPEIEARIADYAARFPAVDADTKPRHRDMPYRRLARLIVARLSATADDSPDGYEDEHAFRGDLEAIASSLSGHRGEHAGLFAVRRALHRVRTFGFHLTTLDVRQDGEVHRRVVGHLLGEVDWQDRTAAERTARLRRALDQGETPKLADSQASEAERDEADSVLAVFKAIGDCRKQYGERAIGPFMISMARDTDDLLTVLLLARWAGLRSVDGGASEEGDSDQVPLDVAPLFETVPDLEAAPAVLERLFSDSFYARHLAGREHRQTVMIGYSDSSKDGGLAASRWALQQGQAALVAVCEAHDVQLTLFHGRGGTVSRGGGKVHRAVMASPPGAVAGRLRVTEQGEMIDDKFGLRGIALRTLERTWGAVALATALPRKPDGREARWAEIMTDVATHSRRAYRARVYEDPEFFSFFRQSTPIDVIELMRIGSRPASRRSKEGIGNLRAIPWVFAWMQSRLMLPGWYGLGSGLAAAVDLHGEDTIAEMVTSWPFFANLVDDAEMVLAKSDMAIARRYAGLAGELGERLFPEIRTEFDLTVELMLKLKRNEILLQDDPILLRSIHLRNPYVDPMSFVQVDLLRRWRAGDRRDDAMLRVLLASIHGIAQGLQNTG